MNLHARDPHEVHNGPKSPRREIVNAEKQLWSLIYSKGLLHDEARDLYIKICSRYEKFILSDHEDVEFQEIEYSLWKLHYKHIHEFRRRISQSSTSVRSTESEIDSHVQKYKSFLTEATNFYQNLISKIRKFYGLGEDPLFEEKGGSSCDPVNLSECQYSCYRFLVCLGDLARYEELCKDIDVQRRNWSVAATYYFKAASSWPDSGNPQNQLAVLAKYIGDDFLALYHCIRSLAVKEPFPDAWNNLMLLLEENRSSHLESLSRESRFNFLDPSERSTSPIKSSPSECDMKNNGMQASDLTSSAKSALWSLFVRMISLFFAECSPEEFSYTFASTMGELDLLLGLDDIKLSALLESYQHMGSYRTGPYRALHLVSIIIFVVNSLTTSFDQKETEEKTKVKQPNLVKSALSAMFIMLRHLTERCLKGNLVKSSPLLPAVLVFVEWLVGMLDVVRKYIFHEEVACAVSYFLDAFVELLNQFESCGEFKHQKDIALWEDCELRGFTPIAHSHKHLNFRTCEEPMGEFVDGNTRVHRIIDAAMKITEKIPDGFQKWIFYDMDKEKFFTVEQSSLVDPDLQESRKTICEAIQEKEKINKTVVMEEEEEIIFKPLARHNSAPIYSPDQETSTDGIKDKTVPSDDSLRRATSLFSVQNQNFHSDSNTSKSNHPLNKHETVLKASATPYLASPPSLNAWVLDKESVDIEKEKDTRDFFKPRLSPINEMGSLSLIDSPPYSAPIPSAPLLPDNALLFCDNSAIHDMNNTGVLRVSPMSGTSPYGPVFGPSSFTPMSSSEWLHRFRNQNLDRGSPLLQPIHRYTPGNFYGHDASRLDLVDRWEFSPLNTDQMVYPEISPLYAGSQLGFVADGLRRDNLFHNYQRPSPYGCGGNVAEIRTEQAPLLHYLKEQERHLQNQPQVKGPAYLGN